MVIMLAVVKRSVQARRHRRGVTTVECAVVLTTLMFVVFCILDLGLAACRYNVLSASARCLCRTAIVRGSMATPQHASWGPTTWSGTAAGSSEMATTVMPFLCTMAPADVNILLTWPSGSNQVGSPVTVQLRYAHQPFSLLTGQWGILQLQATATMPIVH